MMKFVNEKITVLYGSQTGNAQDIAERIWRESKRFYFAGTVRAMDDYDVRQLVSDSCVIFVCSTTGQGEEPDNMRGFWRFLLRKNLPAHSLQHLKYAVLGLGDSSYVKFNFVAKRLNKRLMQLGAQVLVPLGLGDDQHDLGYDAAADPFIESLWEELAVLYPLPYGVQALSRHQKVVPRWNVSTTLSVKPSSVNTNQSIYYSSRASEEFPVTVKENIRVTHADHFQDVRLIKLKTNGQKYFPGDVLCLRPRNSPQQVLEFQNVLKENGVHIEPSSEFNISGDSSEIPVPACLKYRVTFQQLCEEYFDLTSVPRRHVFSILGQLTDSEIEREKCLEFTSAEGQNDLYNYCNRPRRHITEVLADFRHATKNIKNDILFELMQPIKARDFSIASSYKYHKDEIHILVAVVQYRTKLVKERLGLCSNYLAGLKENDEVSVWVKKGSFRFPTDPKCPVIMIGPGTGMAPFRNYIFERVKDKTANAKDLILFFGCRSRDSDFYCVEDQQLHNEGKLTLITAFSRDQEYKVYVQHKIKEHGERVWDALKTRQAYIFVAGNSKGMPQDVRESFKDVCVQIGGATPEAAEKIMLDMEKNNRYQTETWS